MKFYSNMKCASKIDKYIWSERGEGGADVETYIHILWNKN